MNPAPMEHSGPSKSGGTSCPTRDRANSWPMPCCRLISSSRLACRTPSSTCAPVCQFNIIKLMHLLCTRLHAGTLLLYSVCVLTAHVIRRGHTGGPDGHIGICYSSIHGIRHGPAGWPLLLHPGILMHGLQKNIFLLKKQCKSYALGRPSSRQGRRWQAALSSSPARAG